MEKRKGVLEPLASALSTGPRTVPGSLANDSGHLDPHKTEVREPMNLKVLATPHHFRSNNSHPGLRVCRNTICPQQNPATP